MLSSPILEMNLHVSAGLPGDADLGRHPSWSLRRISRVLSFPILPCLVLSRFWRSHCCSNELTRLHANFLQVPETREALVQKTKAHDLLECDIEIVWTMLVVVARRKRLSQHAQENSQCTKQLNLKGMRRSIPDKKYACGARTVPTSYLWYSARF